MRPHMPSGIRYPYLQNLMAYLSVQEAAKLMPGSFWHLSLCSKAWSDLTYMDEIQGKYREGLSSSDKREVNEKALEFSSQVSVPAFSSLVHPTCLEL